MTQHPHTHKSEHKALHAKPQYRVPAYVQTFINLHLNDAFSASRKYGIPVGVILAQSGLETSFGMQVKGNAWFGVKGKSDSGSTTFTTHEVIKGKSVSIKDSFRAFANYREALDDYCTLLTTNKHYTSAFAYKGQSIKFAEQIGRSGYATDPRYGQKLVSIIKQNHLDSFDTTHAPVNLKLTENLTTP